MNGFGQGSVTPSRMPRHRRSLPRINDRVDRYDGCECDPVILVDLTERCFLEEDSVFKGPANKQQEISASKKANSSTVKSDHTTSKNAKHMAGASVKTAKVKSPENKSEKPHSAAAIRQTVSQRRCRRSDTPDDDKILPLCSAQSVMTSKVNTHKLEANMRRRSRRLKEYSFVLTSIVFTLVFIIFDITTLGWYLAFTAHKTVGFELAMREPLNAAWKLSSPFKMRRKGGYKCPRCGGRELVFLNTTYAVKHLEVPHEAEYAQVVQELKHRKQPVKRAAPSTTPEES